MVVIKRNGKEVSFNKEKIFLALSKANQKLEDDDKLSLEDLRELTSEIIED